MIEPVSDNNIDEVLPLIRKYLEFYKVADISDSRNKEFFSQFGASNPAGCQFIFRESGSVVGFATVYFTFTSSITAKVAVLNDLYTSPGQRGKGVGRQLIEHCRSFAAKNGAARLQWVTAPDNEPAQKLYDSLQTGKSSWHFYTYNT
ncbi:MAG: GNAT family N-acetyltransferase [Oleispira sp.]|nr:GNAT family N-acetyltransferase [Oleispira sp.]MBL4880819.1 GNAT family N-acetyltransferase [Oleispira sp.]